MSITHLAPAAVADRSAGLGGLVEQLDTLLDSLTAEASQPTAVTTRDVSDVDRVIRRLQGIKLTLIAKADEQRAHIRSGDTSTSAWLNGATRAGGGAAAREVGLAVALEQSLPATKDALGRGDLSPEAAGIIHSVMSKLPETLSDTERTKVEDSLVRDARTLEPARLRKRATTALAAAEKSAAEVAAHQESVLVDEETKAYRQSYLTIFDRGDGTSQGRFTVPTSVAALLRKILHTMTSPRRDHQHRNGGTQPVSGRSMGSGVAGVGAAAAGAAGRPDATSGARAGSSFVQEHAPSGGDDWASLSWADKHGRAFVDLLEHLDTERLNGKTAATVVVTMSLEQVLGAAHAAQLATLTGTDSGISEGAVATDAGHQLSTSTARRLACSAGLVPAVLGGPSLPLDLGRQDRFSTEAHRVSLATVYSECATDGCDRPYAWTELHHEDPWGRGGRTDLRLAVPLCGHHHRLIHNPGIEHRIITDAGGIKTVRFGQRC